MNADKNKSISRKDAKSAKAAKKGQFTLREVVNKPMKPWLKRLGFQYSEKRPLPVRLNQLLKDGFSDVGGCVLYAKDSKGFILRRGLDAAHVSRLSLHIHIDDEVPRLRENVHAQLRHAINFAQMATNLMKVQFPQYDFIASVSIDPKAKSVTVHPERLTTSSDLDFNNFHQPVLQYRTD